MIDTLRDNASTVALIGGLLTSVGLILAVVGLGSVRNALRRYVEGGRRFLFAWRVPAEDEIEEVLAPGVPEGPDDQDPDSVLVRIARLEAQLRGHGHLETERRLMEVAEADRTARTELLRALDDMDRAASASGRYLVACLALALAGTTLQALALLL